MSSAVGTVQWDAGSGLRAAITAVAVAVTVREQKLDPMGMMRRFGLRRRGSYRAARPTGLAALAALTGFFSAPSLAVAQSGTVKAQHGDWQVVCKPPPPGARNEICALVQSVTAEDRNNVGLTVYFQVFSNGTRVLRVFAPLGVLLPPGLGLKIDDRDVGNAPFLRCQNFACYAQVVVEDKFIEQLKSGKTAVFIIFQTEEAGIGIPISLGGFSQALAALR
jgi:invasion protein IalB